jgi:hypothetical protein
MTLILAHWKKILLIVALVAAFLAGRGLKPQPEIVVKEKVVEKIVEKVVEKKNEQVNKVKKTITKPDGTIIVEEKEEWQIKTNTVKQIESDKKTDTLSVSKMLSKYRLGFQAEIPIDKLLNEPLKDNLDYSINGGLRLIGPLWLESGIGLNRKELRLGVSWEF